MIKTIFLGTTTDKGKVLKLFYCRATVLFSLALLAFATQAKLDYIASRVDPTIYEGTLLETYPSSGTSSFLLSTLDDEIKISTYRHAPFLEKLESMGGARMKVWTYTRPGAYFFPEEFLVQIEVNNERLIEDRMYAMPTRKETWTLYLSLMAFLVIILSGSSIIKILKDDQNATKPTSL